MDDSAIQEIIELYDEKTNLNEKKPTCKMRNFYILLSLLLITTALSIAVITDCYLIKNQERENLHYHLPSQIRN